MVRTNILLAGSATVAIAITGSTSASAQQVCEVNGTSTTSGTAAGANSLACGGFASDPGGDPAGATAIGISAVAIGDGAVAVGSFNNIDGDFATGVGSRIVFVGVGGTAVGYGFAGRSERNGRRL